MLANILEKVSFCGCKTRKINRNPKYKVRVVVVSNDTSVGRTNLNILKQCSLHVYFVYAQNK